MFYLPGPREAGELILYPCHGLDPQYFELCYLKSIRYGPTR